MCVSSIWSGIRSSSIHSAHLSSQTRPPSDPSWISTGARQNRGNPGITVAALALARMLARSITESSRTGSKHCLSHSHSPRAGLEAHRRHSSTGNTAVIAEKCMFSAWMMDGLGFIVYSFSLGFGALRADVRRTETRARAPPPRASTATSQSQQTTSAEINMMGFMNLWNITLEVYIILPVNKFTKYLTYFWPNLVPQVRIRVRVGSFSF